MTQAVLVGDGLGEVGDGDGLGDVGEGDGAGELPTSPGQFTGCCDGHESCLVVETWVSVCVLLTQP